MLSILRCSTNRLQLTPLIKIFSRHHMKISPKMQRLYRQIDHIPHNYDLVYRQLNYRMPSFGYHIIQFLACSSVVSFGILWYNGKLNFEQNVLIPGLMQFIIVIAFTSLSVVLVTAMRRRFVIRMYSNEKDKVCRAIFIGKLPFTIEACQIPYESLTFVKNSSNPFNRNVLCTSDGRKIILVHDNFRTQRDYHLLLKPGELEFEK